MELIKHAYTADEALEYGNADLSCLEYMEWSRRNFISEKENKTRDRKKSVPETRQNDKPQNTNANITN